MKKAILRVEARDLGANPSRQERDYEFKRIHSIFKTLYNREILKLVKQNEFYESPGREARRKKRESERARFKAEKKLLFKSKPKKKVNKKKEK